MIRAAKKIIESQLELRAAVKLQAAADGTKGPPTFSMEAYTGGAMNLSGWRFPVVVDMNGIKGMDKQRPVLRDHNPGQILGHTTAVTVMGGKLMASGVISGHGEHVDEVVSASGNGFPWQASIGARVASNQFVPEGETETVNGHKFSGPINVARKTLLGEISFVAMGADDNTSARIAATEAAKGSIMTFEQWLEANGFDAATLTKEGKAVLLASYKVDEEEEKPEPEVKAEEKPLDIAAQIKASREAQVAETKRVDAIRGICLKAGAPKMTLADKTEVSIEAAAIDEGWTAEKTELYALRAERKPVEGKGHAFGINVGAGSESTPAIIAAAACLSSGMPEKVALNGLDDKGKNIALSRQLRGIGLHAIMGMVAASLGIHLAAGGINDDSIKRILKAEQQLDLKADATGGFSTMSLSGITENILNKAMLMAYDSITSVVGDICYETDTNDFKQYKRYRLTASGAMQPLGPAGELKSMSLQDESYANQVATIGTIMTITRNILINDDMGALTQIPTVIGRQAALARERAVFLALLANTSSFFGTGHVNYLSGAGSVLSITSLTSAVQKFLEQKDANSDPIALSPDRLLVPPALYATADNLFNGANLVVGALGSTSSKSLDVNLNQHARRYRPIVSAYLSAAIALTGASDTGWYLLGNPSGGMATVQIGYLRGQRVPIIERGEANFTTLGIAMRAFYDFGVALHDYRTGVFSAGA